MSKVNPPNLLILDDLLEPIRNARHRIKHIIAASPEHDDSSLGAEITRQGLYALSVATLETAVSDTHAYYLGEFPVKVGSLVPSVEEAQLGEGIAPAVQRQVINATYKDFRTYLQRYCKDLSIEVLDLPGLDEIGEIKATRNLLLHNNLVVNDQYVESAGRCIRSNERHARLPLDADYLAYALTKEADFLDKLRAMLEGKYSGPSYTRAGAFRRLWDWVYDKGDRPPSPACKFDDYWQASQDGHGIQALMGEDRWSMSSGERMFLWVFRTHYNEGDYQHLAQGFTFARLDPKSRRKMSYVLQVIAKLRLGEGYFKHGEDDPFEE